MVFKWWAFCCAAGLLLAVTSGTAAPGPDRLGIRIGMSGADAAKLLQGHCPTTWQPAPYITCVDGSFVITATLSAKDRIYYIQRLEPTEEPNEVYASRIAAELGFNGPGTECKRNDDWAMCWQDSSGTQLFSGMQFSSGIIATQLLNERIVAEDGAD